MTAKPAKSARAIRRRLKNSLSANAFTLEAKPTAAALENAPERLQKVLAEQGFGSRRDIEQWIAQGEIIINGEVAKLGQKVLLSDKIELRGQRLRLQKTKKSLPLLILYHKPPGEIVSKDDPQGRPSVFDRLPLSRRRRLIAIGRLDFNTSGLLLFTDDGQLADFLLHPRQGWEREYAVRIFGEVNTAMRERLQQGVTLEDGLARFQSIDFAGGEGKNQWYRVIVKEGRYREVRRLWESQGVTVSRLIRIRFAAQVLPPNLKQGEWLRLSNHEVQAFLKNHGYRRSPLPKQRPVKAPNASDRTVIPPSFLKPNPNQTPYEKPSVRTPAQSSGRRPRSRPKGRRDH